MKKLISLFIAFCTMSAVATAAPAKPKAKAKAAAPVESIDDLRGQAAAAFADYDLDRLDDIAEKMRKHNATEAAGLENRVLTMRNMLERVENIQILDSLSVDSASFFKYYKLSPQAGIIDADGGAMPYYRSQLGGEMIAVSGSESEGYRLISVGILDDDTRQPAVDITMEGKVPDYDTAYPFMQQDGTTLYFAMRNAADGIGGWDIYMTRRDDEGGFLAPTNFGMPYNSPANDYLLAIDEATGLGWWATDRNADPGKVTIYVFAPNDSRVNLDADRDDIVDRARITDISATRPVDGDLSGRLNVLKALEDDGEDEDYDEEILLSLGNGTVYTWMSQFKNPQAAAEMQSYLDEAQRVDDLADSLEDMRARYGAGDLTLADRIRTAEQQLDRALPRLQKMLNNVIRLELQ